MLFFFKHLANLIYSVYTSFCWQWMYYVGGGRFPVSFANSRGGELQYVPSVVTAS